MGHSPETDPTFCKGTNERPAAFNEKVRNNVLCRARSQYSVYWTWLASADRKGEPLILHRLIWNFRLVGLPKNNYRGWEHWDPIRNLLLSGKLCQLSSSLITSLFSLFDGGVFLVSIHVYTIGFMYMYTI